MDQNTLIVADFAALFIAACLYALLLRRLRAWYRRKNKTWVMVIGGVTLVLALIGLLIPFGVVDLASWGIFILAFCVAGVPIAVGEMLQDAHDAGVATRGGRDEEARR
jgi:hypothetical protein